MKTAFTALTLALACCQVQAQAAAPAAYDVVVYGGTSAGVMAAVQARRMGKTAVIVCPDTHLGGLSSGGLGYTDSGNKQAIGGLSREFYHRVWKHYQSDAAWKWESRRQLGKLKSQGGKEQGAPQLPAMWLFEPHVAEDIFEEFIAEYEVPVFRDEWLDTPVDFLSE